MRFETLQAVAKTILKLNHVSEGILIVGIDGSDGSGKTHFSAELKSCLESLNLAVASSSIDHFHNPKEVRYQLGQNSPKGFFLHSHNFKVLVDRLFEPVASGEPSAMLKYFDCDRNAVSIELVNLKPIDVLLFDGLFLLRNETTKYLDLSIYLDVDFSVSVPRGNSRFNLDPNPHATSNQKYVNANKHYQKQFKPRSKANIVIDNNDLAAAIIVRNLFSTLGS
jgi:uridine kinase